MTDINYTHYNLVMIDIKLFMLLHISSFAQHQTYCEVVLISNNP